MRKLLDDEETANVCSLKENEELQKEIDNRAAFVDGFDSDDVFLKFFSNKYDTILGSLPGNMENFKQYPFENKLSVICKRIFSNGIESKHKRECEIEEFEQFIEELNGYVKSKSAESVEQYLSVKQKELGVSSKGDRTLGESLNVVRRSLDELYYELMKYEVEMEDQLEDNMEDFERALTAIMDQFLQSLEDEVVLCREAENEYSEQVSNHCFHLFEKVSLANMGVEVTPQLKKMFEDKESLTDYLADCHSERINSIDLMADSIHDRYRTWLRNTLDGLKKAHITDRRRARISVLEMDDLSDLTYRGEGNNNIVLSDSKGMIYRIRKSPNPSVLPTKKTRAIKKRRQLTVLFGQNRMAQYFGSDFVHPLEIIEVDSSILKVIDDLFKSKRPAFRLNRGVDLNTKKVIAAPDATCIPPPFNSFSEGPTICVEIKNKLRMWGQPSSYCPCDLFSGNHERMLRALLALLAVRQNNLRVFRDSQCILNNSTDHLDAALMDFFRPNSSLNSLSDRGEPKDFGSSYDSVQVTPPLLVAATLMAWYC
ncbi:hypothetical protein Aperf_G00000016022 [Anoplocephala perfoliata]